MVIVSYTILQYHSIVFSHLLVCSLNTVGNGEKDKQDQQAKHSLSLLPEPGWRTGRERDDGK